MRSLTDWQETLRSMAIEMQDVAVAIDGDDEEAAGWMYRAAANLLGETHRLDKARDELRATHAIRNHQ